MAMKKTNHKYRLKYRFDAEVGSFDKSEARTKDDGLSDALVLFSLIYPGTGEFSQMFVSKDGRTGKNLADKELFKVWVLLGKTLSNPHRQGGNNGLSDEQRAMASFPYKMVVGKCKRCEELNKMCGCGGKDGE